MTNINRINVSLENFRIIQPLLIVSRCFGLCPIYYRNNGSSYILEWSLLYSIYSYLIVISATCLAVFGLVNDLYLNSIAHRMTDRTSKIVTGCDISVVIIISVFCIAGTTCRMRVFWNFLRCCNKIDSIIPLKNIQRYRIKSISFITLILTLFSLLEIFDITVWSHVSKNETNFTYLRDYFGFYLLYYLIIAQEIFFWHVVFFLKIRISSLNEYLVLEDEEQKEYRNLRMVNIDLDSLSIYRRSEPERPVFKRKNLIGVTTSQNFNERIIVLAELHRNISNCIDYISSSVSTGIVLIVLSCLDHLIVTPYFFVKEILSNNGNSIFICLQVSWIITHICRLLIVVEPCHLCLNEGRRTIYLACDLLASQNINKQERATVEMFAMQVAQNKIKFSCCGLFELSRSIITSVAGAVTTYLVILFQLNNN